MGNKYKASKLDLSNQSLTDIPKDIYIYKNLKYLNLSHNKLQEIPIEIFELTNLRRLDLSYNVITSIYSKISRLKKLEVLNLNHNKIKILSKQLFTLSNLEKLLIANNDIKEIPDDIKGFPRLRAVNFSSNRLSSFPSQLLNVSTLERLWLNNMAFENIPIEKIKNELTNLKGLYFYGARIYEKANPFQLLYDTKGNALKSIKLLSFNAEIREKTTTINQYDYIDNMKHKIFVSYSHKDEKYREDVETSLKSLTNTVEKLDFEFWDDRKIIPGTEWKKEIEKQLEGATIGILIISRNFFASNFIMQKEVPVLLEKLKKSGTKLLGIVAGSCSFEKHFVRDFQTVNSPNMPLSSLKTHEQELVFTTLENTICDIIDGKI